MIAPHILGVGDDRDLDATDPATSDGAVAVSDTSTSVANTVSVSAADDKVNSTFPSHF